MDVFMAMDMEGFEAMVHMRQKITSVSYGLIQDLWQISARNGYNCSVITEERVNKQTVYNLMFYGLTAESLYESKYNNNIIYDWEYQEANYI